MALAIKALTAVLSIGIGVGVVWFVIANAYEPFFAVDVHFYFNLYAEILLSQNPVGFSLTCA